MARRETSTESTNDRGKKKHHSPASNPNGVDGIFVAGTTTAVKNFQSGKRGTVDGMAGKKTMYALYN